MSSLRPFALAAIALALAAPLPAGDSPAMPPFPSARAQDWIGPPATWESLRGKVVLLDVWTLTPAPAESR